MTSPKLVYLIGRDSITITIGNDRPLVVAKTHIHYETILDALKSGDLDTAMKYAKPVRQAIVDELDGLLELRDNVIYFDGKPLRQSFVARILSLLKDGFDIKPMINWFRNLLDNPSKNAVEELWDFMEANGLPVTADGHFIAYKMINENYTDIYTGTMDNSVGATPKMRRNEVNEDKDDTCADGLHFAGLNYVLNGSYGSRGRGHRLVALKINPANVVTIPSDYGRAKGRACEYLIWREMGWDDRLPITEAVGFRFVNESEIDQKQAEAEEGKPVILTPASSGGYRQKGTKYTEDEYTKVLSLLAPKADGTRRSLREIESLTGMSRRHIARVRDAANLPANVGDDD